MSSKPWQIAPATRANVALCIRAAEMLARSVSYRDIAKELGLDSAVAAKKCAGMGYGLAPGEDLSMARRRAASELDLIRREYWKLVDDPGPLTSATGKVILDPATGLPYPDKTVRAAAVRGLKDANAEYRKLHGTDAPRQSMSIIASVPLEEMHAEIERKKAEVAEAERQEAMEAYPGPEDDDDGPEDDDSGGMRALPPGGGS